jgi:exopolysaccharide biosynthesis protein
MDVSGGLVLSAREGSAKGDQLAALPVGDTVNVTWTYGWPGVADAIAGSPQILDDREIVAPTNCGYICYRHPRSGVGITAKGKILFVVVDGRDPGRSVGMNLAQFARLMRREGAVDALNFDGGGSATMIVKGKVVNRPSDGRQRSVANALLVLPGGDKGERPT